MPNSSPFENRVNYFAELVSAAIRQMRFLCISAGEKKASAINHLTIQGVLVMAKRIYTHFHKVAKRSSSFS